MRQSPARCLCLILMLPMLAWAQASPKDHVEESVDRALAFLALLQEKDGSWQGQGIKHPAVTSLAVMAYLSAGHVPGEGPYQANIDKGIRWVLSNQQPNGMICTQGWEEMYQHGISTLMLAEVVAMTDAKLGREIKPKLETAVKRILQGQRTENGQFKGGWRYRLDSADADMSITGWQVMALRAAKNIGCDVPADRIDLALHFVNGCHDSQTGGFGYGGPSGATPACTAIGILSLELAGREQRRSRPAIHAGSWLLKNPIKYEDAHFFYSAYYGSQAMFQLGANYWTIYRPRLHKVLLDNQQRNGSWINNEGVGTSYSTAMGILALTVEYRYLPIYQRDEEADALKQK